MSRRIFNIKNFVRALAFGILTFLLYELIDFIFKDGTDFRSSLIVSVIIFSINFLVGAENVTWKELFFGKKKIKNRQ